MKTKKILAILCSTAMLVCLSACNDSSNDESQKETTEETTEIVTENEETDAATEIAVDSESLADSDVNDELDLNGEDPQELILNILQMGFESSFGENMIADYEEDNNNYVISIWQDGLAANLESEATADVWNSMVDTIVAAIHQMVDAVRQIDSTANVTLNILSDENQNDILLTIYNGEVTFNAAE